MLKQSIDFANQWTGFYIIAKLDWNMLGKGKGFLITSLLSIINLWKELGRWDKFYPTVVLLGNYICTFYRINSRSFKAKYNSIYYQLKRQYCFYQIKKQYCVSQKNSHYLKMFLKASCDRVTIIRVQMKSAN